MEDEGQWPGVLAEGYTSLIPKPGEVGPLGTRPLTVLSMVYRLWAGTRLRDVLLWQEAWAHPEAYGFLPCRGPIDGAGVTAVLLELARLKGGNPAGLSLDYVKCFDIIPQAVVVRVARELGMDRGTLRALAAMYRQLRRAFWLAGRLGEWWRATNGILQGGGGGGDGNNGEGALQGAALAPTGRSGSPRRGHGRAELAET